MCYFATYQGLEIIFEKGDISKKKGQIIVTNAKNCSDCNNQIPPQIISLHRLQMQKKDRAKIKRIFAPRKTARKKDLARKQMV